MPELPEVEVVRRGINEWATGRVIESVRVLHPRAVRHMPTPLADALVGESFACASRRGKYLWLPLASDPDRQCLVIHLGMSGQVLMQPPASEVEIHARVVVGFTDGGRQMRFVDQRTFGGMYLDTAVPIDTTSGDAGEYLPSTITHIARDLLDPHCDRREITRAIRSKNSEIKRVLLDQSVVSGIGNIYADEALWRTGLHGARIARSLSVKQVADLLDHAAEVMTEALAQGGTSFDSLYVNVNGESGYFSRDLAAYGREGEPCGRCGRPIRRESFMNRSSFRCPGCQRRPPQNSGRPRP